ncbi:MAG: 2-polyprenyl-6-methoxyphenol hydroxylase-like FAD-dependent oxidoreductase [Oceanicoccus sp.]|jgi:2-polyprenyl-6-methoxyphenol hydroxylase-like FAD-dependent oxidoreductase
MTDIKRFNRHPFALRGNSRYNECMKTSVCIVGGGPAGVVLSYLFAKEGIKVTLLESEKDFDRNFRGDTVHPSVMELMDELGFADELHKLPHTKIHKLGVEGQGSVDFTRLKSKFPYITLMHQKDFLNFMVEKAKVFSNFTLLMHSNAQKIIEKNGKVVGVEYVKKGAWTQIDADLVVGADGRFSKMRSVGNFELVSNSAPMDVLWFRLPKIENEDFHSGGKISGGKIIVALEREEYWQMGFIIEKGSYHDIREAGISAFQDELGQMLPSFRERAKELSDWKEISLLVVESSRVTQWYRDGLLLIGDAAHVMTPVGGVGINQAIKDAVETFNQLILPLKENRLTEKDLARVQAKRIWSTRWVQLFQRTAQNQIFKKKKSNRMLVKLLRGVLKNRLINRFAAHLLAIGFKRIHLKKL